MITAAPQQLPASRCYFYIAHRIPRCGMCHRYCSHCIEEFGAPLTLPDICGLASRSTSMASAGRCRLNVAHGFTASSSISSLSFAEWLIDLGSLHAPFFIHMHTKRSMWGGGGQTLAAALACRPGRRRYAIVTTRGHSPTAAATSEIDQEASQRAKSRLRPVRLTHGCDCMQETYWIQ